MKDELVTFFGKPLDQMTREELIVAVKVTSAQLREQQLESMAKWDFVRKAIAEKHSKGC